MPTPGYLAASHEPGLAQVAGEMSRAARALLDGLDEQQRARIRIALEDEERLNWHYVPRARKGVPMKDLTPPQRQLVRRLLETALSERGQVDARQIIQLETVLRSLERRSYRDPELYFVTIFGEPKEGGTWGWRFEGHHLSLNFTVINGQFIAGAPSFFGANPAAHGDGENATRVLAPEEALGRKLVKVLPEAQRARAIIAERAFGDIQTGASREAAIGEPAGVALADLSPEHQEQLQALVRHYAQRLRPELAEKDLAEIASTGWEKVHFAWAGGIEPGQGHYYRLHGPTFLVEYDNTQNNANHIHTAWRDRRNDFGRDLLREHYENQRQGAHGHTAR